MKRLIWGVIATLLAVSLALGLVRFCGQRHNPPGANFSEHFEPEVGGTVPDVDLPSLGSKSRNLSEVLKSGGTKLALVNFWATWCEGCVIEMPSMHQVYMDYKDKGLDVIAVSVDENPAQVLPRFLEKMGLKFPVYVDRGGKLSDLFHVSALPVTYLITADRKIVQIEMGDRNWNTPEFRSRIESLLTGN